MFHTLENLSFVCPRRFLLKSQGLWKSEYKSDTVDDGAYILLDEPPKTDELDGVSSQEV